MTENAEANLDEGFALELLKNYLIEHGATEFQCEVNANDPPDLVVTWETGTRWGVEVTRAYQQVEAIDKATPVSSEHVAAHLRTFAKTLGETTEHIRRRGYSLYLEGPGPLNSWKQTVSFKKWKKATEEVIREHITSGKSEELPFPSGSLTPGEPGKRWTVMIGSSVAEISSSTAAMLRRAVSDKTKGLPNWKGSFDQRWLLILNCNPLVDDVAEVESTLRQLVQTNQGLVGLDGIFWSGIPDRTLVEVLSMEARVHEPNAGTNRRRLRRRDSGDNSKGSG